MKVTMENPVAKLTTSVGQRDTYYESCFQYWKTLNGAH